jgi:hypothetical protein
MQGPEFKSQYHTVIKKKKEATQNGKNVSPHAGGSRNVTLLKTDKFSAEIHKDMKSKRWIR